MAFSTLESTKFSDNVPIPCEKDNISIDKSLCCRNKVFMVLMNTELTKRGTMTLFLKSILENIVEKQDYFNTKLRNYDEILQNNWI